MKNRPDMTERIGTAINELDIDFSQFTLAGWLVSLLSLGAGGGVAYFVCSALIKRNGLNLAAGMTFCLAMIAVTTIAFLTLRWFFQVAGLTVTKSNPVASHSSNANRDTLERMASDGMDMTAIHPIDFWHRFESVEDAEKMAQRARHQSLHVVSIDPDDVSSGYSVQIQVELVPTRNTISNMEQTLAVIAAQCNGHSDGWGVLRK
jgi:regulator of RNase E activity RraB